MTVYSEDANLIGTHTVTVIETRRFDSITHTISVTLCHSSLDTLLEYDPGILQTFNVYENDLLTVTLPKIIGIPEKCYDLYNIKWSVYEDDSFSSELKNLSELMPDTFTFTGTHMELIHDPSDADLSLTLLNLGSSFFFKGEV